MIKQKLLVATLALLGLAFSPSIHAATLIVNNAGDEPDKQPGDGICATSKGTCTLRAAIQEANALPGADDIPLAIPQWSPGSPPVHIILSTPLPIIYSEVHLNGYYNFPYASPNTLAIGNNALISVVLDGSGKITAPAITLSGQGSSGSSVSGLAIVGFPGTGIRIEHGSSQNKIYGNFIGTDGSGSTDDLSGALRSGSPIVINGAPGNEIGSPKPANRNLIACDVCSAISVFSGSDSTAIVNNYVGTRRDGKTPITKYSLGVATDSSSLVISQNILSGQGGISLSGSSNTLITENHIGISADDLSPLNCAATGILISSSPTHAALNNLIANNSIANCTNGIFLDHSNNEPAPTSGNTFTGNKLFNMSSAGIYLMEGNTFPPKNDLYDEDAGVNHTQNFPVANNAYSNGTATTLSYSLNSTPNSIFNIEVFASKQCNPLGYGDGERYLHHEMVTTNPFGGYSNTVTNLPALPSGYFLTLTATDMNTGDTSGFSKCIAVRTLRSFL